MRIACNGLIVDLPITGPIVSGRITVSTDDLAGLSAKQITALFGGSGTVAAAIRSHRRSGLPEWRRKHEYPCCAATRDDYGRLCIGWCGPGCMRRPVRRSA